MLKNTILLGQVVPSTLKNAVKVQVPYFTFDDRLKAYFKKSQEYVAEDFSKSCKTGDVVIIHKIDKQVKKEITHTVFETVFKLGDIKDPISGESVVANQYRASADEMAELYGRDQKNFDYSSAPERGRLEGIRDFTDKPVYRKWNNFEKDDPYGVEN